MAMLGDSDFKVDHPTNDDLVKKGAGWIRDIKLRLKTWAAVSFNLDTGHLGDEVVEGKHLAPIFDEVQEFTKVTVSREGLVIAGTLVDLTPIGQPRLHVYTTTNGGYTGHVVSPGSGTDGDGLPIKTYTLQVPAGVKRLDVEVFGAGGGGGKGAAGVAGGGAGGGYARAIFDVVGNETFQVQVGVGGAGATAGTGTKGARTQIFLSELDRRATAYGGPGGTPTAGGAASQPPETVGGSFFSHNGQPGAVDRGGSGGLSGDGGAPGVGSGVAGEDGSVSVVMFTN